VDSILQEQQGVDGIQMVVVVDGKQMEVDDIQMVGVVVDSIQDEGVDDGILMEVVGVVDDVQVVVGAVDGIHEVDERAAQ